SRDRQRVPAAAPSHEAPPVRPPCHAVSRVLHAEALQQELRAASRSLVRAEPPGRRFRRDLRRVAGSAVDVGRTLRGLACAAEAGISGSAHARTGAHAAAPEVEASGGSAAAPPQDARRALPEETRALRPRTPRLL